MPTFADLGIPFPLYEAPVETCPDYVGAQLCCVSGEHREHCFSFENGGYVRLPCLGCGKQLFVKPAPDQFPTACIRCGAPVLAPLVDGDAAYVSYEALRAGDAIFTKDTEYGMISWEQLVDGWTHGRPGLSLPEFETRITGSGWTEVKLASEVMRELVATPDFVTWQGAEWLFDGDIPMTYVGEWTRQDFVGRAPHGMSPEQFFRNTMRRCDDRLWEYADGVCIYVFQNLATGRYAANYDMD